MANDGANAMLRVVLEGASRVIGSSVFPAVLGTIQADMSLVVDGLPDPIPAEDYLPLDYLTGPQTWQTEDAEGHTHTIKPPATFFPLKPGDRVVCLPLNGGSDYVILGRLS